MARWRSSGRWSLASGLVPLGLGGLLAWQLQQGLEQSRRRETERQLYLAAQLVDRVVEPAAESDPLKRWTQVIGQLPQQVDWRWAIYGQGGRCLATHPAIVPETATAATAPDVLRALQGAPAWSTQAAAAQRPSLRFLAYPLRPPPGPGAPYVLRLGTPWASAPKRWLADPRWVAWPSGLAAIVAAGVTWLALRRGQQVQRQLAAGLQAVAAGNLDFSLDQADEETEAQVAQAYDQMRQSVTSRLAELRIAGDRLATIVGSMVEGVLAVDDRQAVLLVNQAARNLLDIAGPSPTGRPLWEVVRNRAVQQAAAAALAQPEPVSSEFVLAGKSRRIVALHATRLPGEPVRGAVLVLHDVTELRRLENLRQEFVANVSHELKTPLTAIKAYAETLLSGAIDDRQNNVGFVRRIAEQGERLHQLILDMLSLARVESDSGAFEIVAVNVAELYDLTLGQHRAAAQAKHIELSAVLPGEAGGAVLADAEGVRQILDNLVDNALKYTPRGGRVTLGVQETPQALGLVVEDTGIGIPPPEQARVFERFYRVDKARSRELGGTGLGLAIVKHLAQAFGGRVELQSQPQRGSRFIVWLPRA